MFAVDSVWGITVFWIAFAGWLIGETIVFRHGRSIDAPGEDRDHGTVWLVLGLGFGAIVAAFVVAALFPSMKLPGGWVLMGLGLVLLVGGVGLRLWAVTVLGSFFQPTVTIQREHRLITAGPYRFVRHPSYTGALLAELGIGLALGNAIGLVVLVVAPIVGYLPRIKAEEAALLEAIGPEYAQYQRSSARLWPGVW